MQVHVQLSSAQQELARAQLGWEPWSGTLYPSPANRAVPCSPALAGISLEVQVTLGGVGLSLVGQQHEVLYGRVSGIQVRAVTGVARQTVELAVQQIQVRFDCLSFLSDSDSKSYNFSRAFVDYLSWCLYKSGPYLYAHVFFAQ